MKIINKIVFFIKNLTLPKLIIYINIVLFFYLGEKNFRGLGN
jgi:hypothetical protein